MGVAQPWKETVETDVRRNEIQNAEPCHIIEHNMYLRYGTQYRVCEEAQQNKPEMHLSVHVADKHVEEGYEEIEEEKAGSESAGYRGDWQEFLDHQRDTEVLVSCPYEYRPDDDFVEHDLKKQFEELAYSDV